MIQFIRTADSDAASDAASENENARGKTAVASECSHAVADVRVGHTSAVAASEGAQVPASRVDVSKLDRAGATASFLCAIHCALMPLVVALLPLLGLSFLASEPVEWALLAASATLGSWSLCLGFRQHRSRLVFMVLGVALALLVAGRIFHEPHLAGHLLHEHHYGIWGPILMVLGGLTMMSAHLLNHRLCHACKKCSADGCH